MREQERRMICSWKPGFGSPEDFSAISKRTTFQEQNKIHKKRVSMVDL